jgi:hypothetical protein
VGQEVSLPRGLCWLIPGVAGGMLHDAWCSPVGLSNVSKAGWSWFLMVWEPFCFLSVTWYREAFHRLRFQGVEALILHSDFFLPRVAPESQQDFFFIELPLSGSMP